MLSKHPSLKMAAVDTIQASFCTKEMDGFDVFVIKGFWILNVDDQMQMDRWIRWWSGLV